MKYRTTITGCGPEAFAFLSKELDLNFVIIFNEDAPEELAELSILHTQERVLAMPVPGCIMLDGPVLTKEAVPVGETIEIY